MGFGKKTDSSPYTRRSMLELAGSPSFARAETHELVCNLFPTHWLFVQTNPMNRTQHTPFFLWLDQALRLGLVCLFFAPPLGFGQSSTLTKAQHQIRQAYVLNQPAQLRQAVQTLLANPLPNSDAWQSLSLLAQYQLVGRCLETENCEDVEALLIAAEKQVEAWLRRKPTSAEAHVMMAGFLGMRIDYSPSRAIFLGPKSLKQLEKAEALHPNEPQLWVEKGNYAFYAPSWFGGDKKQAERYFQRASTLYAQLPVAEQSWLALYTEVYLAQSQLANGNAQAAIATYEKLLQQEPDFGWVKTVLLPEARRQTGK
jgi:tetratricopeptide (TPR) repeat protein